MSSLQVFSTTNYTCPNVEPFVLATFPNTFGPLDSSIPLLCPNLTCKNVQAESSKVFGIWETIKSFFSPYTPVRKDCDWDTSVWDDKMPKDVVTRQVEFCYRKMEAENSLVNTLSGKSFRPSQASQPKVRKRKEGKENGPSVEDNVEYTFNDVFYTSDGSLIQYKNCKTSFEPQGPVRMWHFSDVIDDSMGTYISDYLLKEVSQEDALFLRERGLAEHHLEDLTAEKITIEQTIGIAKVFSNFDGDALFQKITESTTHHAETESFRRWEEDPTHRCSKEGISGNKKFPTALVLQAKHHRDSRIDGDFIFDQLFLRELDEVYDICKRIFWDAESFNNALTSFRRPIDLLFVFAHGQQDHIQTQDNVFFKISKKIKNKRLSSTLSKLSSRARIVLMGCSTGAGRNKKRNMANHFALNAPQGTTVIAPTENYANFQVAYTRNPIRWGFWNFSRFPGNAPVTRHVHDITYVADSNTDFSALESEEKLI